MSRERNGFFLDDHFDEPEPRNQALRIRAQPRRHGDSWHRHALAKSPSSHGSLGGWGVHPHSRRAGCSFHCICCTPCKFNRVRTLNEMDSIDVTPLGFSLPIKMSQPQPLNLKTPAAG
jgi:hypothetical protein